MRMEATDYVSYELAVKLKDAGFDEPCDKWIASKSFSYYDEDECCDHNAVIRKGWLISQKQKDRYDKEALPYLSLWQAQKWLREKKHLSVEPYANIVANFNYNIADLESFADYKGQGIGYESYECALAAGLFAALELIKK